MVVGSGPNSRGPISTFALCCQNRQHWNAELDPLSWKKSIESLIVLLVYPLLRRVDLLPHLNLYESSGKLVLERSELGKSCLRQDATLFAEGSKFARDIFCQKRQKMRVTSFVRDAHIEKIRYRRAS
jgi:hypothetical protein